MKKIATDQPGSGSAIVLEMLLNSLGLSGSVGVVHEQKSLADQIAGLLSDDYDGVFRMAAQGDRTVKSAMEIGGVNLVGLDQWSLEGHTARYSFIRPTTIPSETYASQFVPVPSVSTQVRPRQSCRDGAGGGRGRARHRWGRERRADQRRRSRGDCASVGWHRRHRPRRAGTFSAPTNHRGGRHGPAIQTSTSRSSTF